MAFNNKLIPWHWGKKQIPVRHEDGNSYAQNYPLMHADMDRVFDNFFNSFPFFPSGLRTSIGFEPKVDVSETDKEIKITAELPGMDENNVEVSISRDSLTIHGEKSEEKEENNNGYHQMERSYGSFHRVIWLPGDVDSENAEATFNRGVLKIRMPKTKPAASEAKKIKIQKSE